MRRSRQRIFHEIRETPILRIASAVVLLFVSTNCDKLGLGSNSSPTAPTGPPTPGSAIVYTAIGASDANGVGSSVQCFPFTDCQNGMGYVPVTVRQLKAQGFAVTLSNLGVATFVIGPDFQALRQQTGRVIEGDFIDQEMPYVPKNSTVVTIFAGGNEVNAITAALGAGAGGADPAGFIDRQVQAFGADYATLLNGIRRTAPSARIIVLNVPNMAGLPYLASASPSQRQAAQRAAVGMTTTVVNPLAGQSITVVDLMCDPRIYQPANYSSDGLHPNDAGYAFIAAQLIAAITSGSNPPPQTSCSAMTLVS
jgi:lysophospholipase L1-like esterase